MNKIIIPLTLLFFINCLANEEEIIKEEEDNCFQIIPNSIIDNKNLIINGEGKMCQWNEEELLQLQENIETIIITDSVTSFCSQCFHGFLQLQTIYIGKGIEILEEQSFVSNNQLETIIITSNTMKINSNAFIDNLKLKNIIATSEQSIEIE